MSRKMKIAFVLSHIATPRFYKKMKKAKEQFEVSMIYRNRFSETFHSFLNDDTITKYEIMDGDFKAWKIPINLYCNFYKKAMTRLKEIKPDIIHCGNLDMLLLTVLYKKRYDQQVKIVYEIGDLNKRTYNSSRKIGKVLLKKSLIHLEKVLCKSVDQLIISSQYFFDEYYINFIPIEKVLLYPNVPEESTFSKVRESNNDILTISFIGQVRYFNQLKMMLDVVKDINRSVGNQVYKVLIAGSGPDSQTLRHHAVEYDFLSIYGAYDYDTEIAEIYSKTDIVYSVYDSSVRNVQVAIPNRLYEAIVSERPIIVARNTKLSEFVMQNKVGFEVDSCDCRDLRQLLWEIYLGNIDLNLLKMQCRLIKDNYFINIYQEKLIAMYQCLVKLKE